MKLSLERHTACRCRLSRLCGTESALLLDHIPTNAGRDFGATRQTGEKMLNKPLFDVRILDLTNVLAGPFCCHQLAHLGAEVIKVEVPGTGDLARQLGADPELNDRRMGVSFLAQNAGKRSLTINLKKEAGRNLFRRLVRHGIERACQNRRFYAALPFSSPAQED